MDVTVPPAKKVWSLLFAAIPIALSLIAYHPIVENYFYADDFYYLYVLKNAPLSEFLFQPYFGHLFAARNFIFFAFHSIFGTEPTAYFVAVLLTHLLNVALLFRLIRLHTGSLPLACLGAALWGTSPLHARTLGWYSVYGQVILATVLLSILLQVSNLRTARTISSWRAILWWSAVLIGCTLFGIGLAVAVCFPLVLVLLAPDLVRRNRRALSGFLFLPVVAATLYMTTQRMMGTAGTLLPPIFSSLRGADLWGTYLPGVLTEVLHCFSVGIAGTLLAPFPFAVDYPSLMTLFAVVSFLVVLATAWIRGGPTLKREVCAWGLLALASYGLVTATRGLLLPVLSGPMAVARVGRYHYVASIFLVVIFCLALAELGKNDRLKRAGVRVLLPGWTVIAAAWLAYSGMKIDHHNRARQRTVRTIASLRSKIKAAPPGRTVFIRNRKYQLAPAPKSSFATLAGAFVTFIGEEETQGRHVYFVDDEKAVAKARQRPNTKMASLLITPTEALKKGWSQPVVEKDEPTGRQATESAEGQ